MGRALRVCRSVTILSLSSTPATAAPRRVSAAVAESLAAHASRRSAKVALRVYRAVGYCTLDVARECPVGVNGERRSLGGKVAGGPAERAEENESTAPTAFGPLLWVLIWGTLSTHAGYCEHCGRPPQLDRCSARFAHSPTCARRRRVVAHDMAAAPLCCSCTHVSRTTWAHGRRGVPYAMVRCMAVDVLRCNQYCAGDLLDGPAEHARREIERRRIEA